MGSLQGQDLALDSGERDSDGYVEAKSWPWSRGCSFTEARGQTHAPQGLAAPFQK
ncbi:hypothetical protein B0G52_11722 [Cohnella sp. SGD-V74]|nr:hypothetical protein B0G52_11722 [Cohnella sp. SGD-V74]